MRVRLLGDVAVEVGDRRVEPPPRTLGLLTVLALSPEGVDRGELASIVAPDRAGAAGRRRLSRLLWLLRDAVPELPVVATARRVALDTAECVVDAVRAEELAEQGDPEADESAIELFKGPLCPGADLPWIVTRRARLDELAVRTGLRVAEARALQDDHQRAWDAAEWVMARQPGSTRALELRLSADRALGRNEDGLALFDRWCQRRGIEEYEAPASVQDLALALREDQPVPDIEPADDAPAQVWLAQVGHATARGDQPARKRALDRLRWSVAAGDLPRAALRLLEVDAALDRHDLALAERLLAMGSRDPDTEALHLRRARLALAHRDLDTAKHEASEALVGAYVDQRDEMRLEALLMLALIESERGRSRDALAAAGEARAMALKAGKLEAELLADVLRGRESIRQGRYRPAADLMRLTRERAVGAGLARVEGQALRELGKARCRMGEFEAADTLLREERALWRRLEYPVAEAAACNEHAYTLICMGRHDEAIDVAAVAARLGEHHDAPLALAWARGFTALALVCRNGADRQAYDAVGWAWAEDIDSDPELVAMLAMLRAFLAHLRGGSSSALADLALARERYTACGAVGHLPMVHALEALVRLGRGEVDAALAATRRGLTELALGSSDDFSLPLHYAHARVLEAAGRHEEARSWLSRGARRLGDIASKSGLTPEALADRDPITRALATELRRHTPLGAMAREATG